MNEYSINVSEVEELQMISNTTQLEKIFTKAKSTVIQGGTVILERKNTDGTSYTFDKITTERDLATYRNAVFKYLND